MFLPSLTSILLLLVYASPATLGYIFRYFKPTLFQRNDFPKYENSCPQSSLVSPKRGAGARVGVGMLRGRGIPLKVLRFLVFSFFCFCWFIGFRFLGFLVPKFQSFTVSRFQSFQHSTVSKFGCFKDSK